MMVYWCDNCLIPIIEKKVCPNCNNQMDKIAKDVRPVFFEEKVLVSLLLGTNIKNNSVWATRGNRYIIDGEKLRIDYSKVKDKECNLSDLRKEVNSKINNNQSLKRDIYIDRFIKHNQTWLNYIVDEAEDYINKVTEKYSTKNYLPIISFSGGKDSTVISNLVRETLEEQRIIHIFGDTTIEFSYTYEYLEEFKTENNLVPFFEEDTDENFMDLCEVFGPPSRLERWCCSIFKTSPIGRVISNFPSDKKALTFMGIRKYESNDRSDYNRTKKKSKISRQISSFPILNWKNHDVWLYILSKDILFNKAYRLGYRRVGCWLCPNNSNWSEFLTRFYMPEKYNKWRSFLLDFAQKAGKEDYKVYVDEGYWKARRGNKGVDTELKEVQSGDCKMLEEAKNYILDKEVDRDFKELMKPFGSIDESIDGDEFKWKIEWDIIKKNKNEKAEIEVRGMFGTEIIKVIPKNVKNIKTFYMRFECQIRKYENCIYCSACDNTCPQSAISTLNNKYKIDETKCIHCKKCIAYFYNGCLKFKALK
ncbi:MAG: phosphoadenosine phosphosulfate reductase family protein [Bacillota bacterium]